MLTSEILIIVTVIIITFYIANVSSFNTKKWITFDINNPKTHPAQGIEVLCYVDTLDTYVAACVVYEGDTLVWKRSIEVSKIIESTAPLCWQYIDDDHVYTKINYK